MVMIDMTEVEDSGEEGEAGVMTTTGSKTEETATGAEVAVVGVVASGKVDVGVGGTEEGGEVEEAVVWVEAVVRVEAVVPPVMTVTESRHHAPDWKMTIYLWMMGRKEGPIPDCKFYYFFFYSMFLVSLHTSPKCHSLWKCKLTLLRNLTKVINYMCASRLIWALISNTWNWLYKLQLHFYLLWAYFWSTDYSGTSL